MTIQPLSPQAHTTYAAIVARGSVPAAELDPGVLAELVAWRLVHGTEAVTAASPSAATHALATQLEQAALRVRESGEALTDIWERQSPDPRIELLQGEQVTHFLGMMLDSAGSTFDSFSIPSRRRAAPDEPPEEQRIAMERGLKVRALYSAEVLDDPHGLALVRTCVSWGEEARVLPQVPFPLYILDNSVACVVPEYEIYEARQLLVFRSQGMVDVLMRTFERFWEMGISIDAESGELADSADDQRLLVLLANGVSDRAVARELGISERTLSRRITALSQRLGAQTRFQLGFQASRWLAKNQGSGS